jgi:hypothetical protein
MIFIKVNVLRKSVNYQKAEINLFSLATSYSIEELQVMLL